jgi:cytochrome P450
VAQGRHLIELAELEGDPHPALARLRATDPVAWLPALGGWLVTGREQALEAMRDAGRFTVDDPRFTTARVVGPSMLSTDGAAHDRHREPFTEPFRRARVHELLGDVVARRTDELIDAVVADGEADLSARLAAPLAASVVTHALGLGQADVDDVLGWYRSIVASVQEMTAGGPLSPEARGAFAALREAIAPVLCADPGSSVLAAASAAAHGGLTPDEASGDVGVLMFGGIETTEGMIANALTFLLEDPEAMALVRERPEALEGAIEETLRLEPAAAIVDRYATADTELGGARIRAGDLVSISVTAANRDPATFGDPDAFDPLRPNARRHLAFASGPHACIGVHLARLEAAVAVGRVLERLPGLRLDPDRRKPIRGLVFRKPATLFVRWDRPAYVGHS